MKSLAKKGVFIILLIIMICFPYIYAQEDDNIYDDEMDPDLNETPIEYRTLEDDDSEDSVYIQTGLTLEELANIISEKLEEWMDKYNIEISDNSKSRIIKDTINELIEKEDFSENSIEESLKNSIIKEIVVLVLDRIEDYNVEFSDKSKEEIALAVLNQILEGDSEGLDVEIETSLKDKLNTIITDIILEELKDMDVSINDENLNKIIVIVIGKLNEQEDKITEEMIREAIKEALDIYFKTDIIPDAGEKIHIVKKGDNLYDLSYEYYDKEERDRGAHWIHIYDYSVKKGFIDPEKQPIKPKNQYKYFVRLDIGQKVAIPYMEGDYPSVEDLLNKYGYTMTDEGDVEDIKTNLPINIDIED